MKTEAEWDRNFKIIVPIGALVLVMLIVSSFVGISYLAGAIQPSIEDVRKAERAMADKLESARKAMRSDWEKEKVRVRTYEVTTRAAWVKDLVDQLQAKGFSRQEAIEIAKHSFSEDE